VEFHVSDLAKLSSLVRSDIRYFIAFGFGSGLMPIAPGTFGTLAAIPVYLLVSWLAWPLYIAFVLVAFLVGVHICNQITRELKIQDYPGIVWDECVGYWITMFLAPPGWQWILFGFILFRFFDILKPPPIRQIDKNLRDGMGIMFDDVLAGLFAWVILQVISHMIRIYG
jgi:phosphatidylglycerophosphatase A